MIHKMTAGQWQDVLDVNLTGAFNCLQAVGSALIALAKEGARRRPQSSTSPPTRGAKGTIGQINYGAAKSGMLSLTHECRARVGSIWHPREHPVLRRRQTAMTETIRSEKFRDTYLARIPLGRWATLPKWRSPCFLLSEASSYVTGQNLSVNGGAFMTA